ncbi:MAG: LysR family transcriptional regulator [Pseudomonadota bacterium]
MDWEDAKYFLAAFREGSYSAAAERLSVSHSTVRRRIGALEAALGARLFATHQNGLTATDAAHAAAPLAERLEAAATALETRVSGDAREIAGSLKVTAVDGLLDLLANAIAEFSSRHRNIDLTINTENRVLDLSRREADVAIRLTNAPGETLFGRRIGRIAYAPYAARALVDASDGEPRNLPFILWDASAEAEGTEMWYAEWSGGRAPAARVTDSRTLAALAVAGLGGAALPLAIGERLGLQRIGPAIDGFDTDVWCLCHHDLRYSDRVRSFMEAMADGAEKAFATR